MATDVLQAFLTKRLFDVGGDDSRVKALRDAADDMAAIIKAAPHRTATFTMIAIDSAIGPDEAAVAEVMKILERRWNSYAGAFTDSKLPTVARAILLHALSIASGSEPIAATISLTARNMLPHLGDMGDRALWSEIVGDADRRLARRSEREWALPSSSAASEIKLSVPNEVQLEHPTVNEDWLKGRLTAAVGPQNAAGEQLKNANPHFPNTGQPWSNEFAPLATTAIAGAVNGAMKALTERVATSGAGEALRAAITEYVSATSAALTQTTLGLERRTALLWWKEALFSPSAGLSYRELDPSCAAALAAVDASAQVGPFAPRMAEAVLRETLLSIDRSAMSQQRSIEKHAAELANVSGGVRAAIDESYATIHTESGRTPLGALMASSHTVTSEVFRERLGVPADTDISAADFGLWLFRDLQASAATPEPSKRKRGGRA